MRRSFLVTGLLLVAALAWAARLASGPGPWAADAAGILAADLVLLAAVAVVGILVAASRWAARLAVGVAAAGLPLALVLSVDPLWWVGLLASAAALGGILGGGLKGYVRERPNAAGPPAEAVILSLGLAAMPGVVAVSVPGGLGPVGWATAGASLAAAAWYVKAAPAATTVVRVGAPLLAVGGAVAAGLPGGLLPFLAGTALTGLAWTASARVAVKPLVESGKPVSIPAELTPKEILDAAGLDERGRRRPDRP